MSVGWTIVLGIATSFVASLVFTFFFTRLRPQIKISPVIAFSNGTFKIKVINKSCSSVINVKAELSYIRYFNVPGGIETKSERIELLKEELFSIDRYKTDSKYATYTYRFVTKENILQKLSSKNKDHIRFKISAIHSLSNIGRVLQKEYSLEKIVDGDFPFGPRIDIS